jgi:hypothetical protein
MGNTKHILGLEGIIIGPVLFVLAKEIPGLDGLKIYT